MPTRMLRAWSALLGMGAASTLKFAIKSHPPSAFSPPAIFEHVCISRLSKDEAPKLLFATDKSSSDGELRPPTTTETSQPPSYINLTPRRAKNSRPSRSGLVEVEQVDIESVYSLSLGDLLNMSHVAELKFIDGTSYLVQTPCKSGKSGYAENYFNALTEEGPLLDMITSAVPLHEGEQGTFLFTNVCPHTLYRDDIRMLLLGRRHGVTKVMPGTINCVKRLITTEITAEPWGVQNRPSPPVVAQNAPRAPRYQLDVFDWKRRGESSLQSYVKRLKTSANQMAHEDHICYPAPADGMALKRFGEPHDACFIGHGSSVNHDSETTASRFDVWPTPAGLRVLLVQRTRSRRIRNMDALQETLRQAFREVTFPKGIARTRHLHGAIELRNAVVQVVFFEEMSLIDEINLMQQVDVLIGVTGSGLSNLAFMRPGSIVLELSSPFHVTDFFPLLISRVHGRLVRGVISYKRLLYEPKNISTADVGFSMANIKPADLDAQVNVQAVTDAVIGEFKARMAGMAI